MALLTPSNCIVSIYAGSNALSPYSLGPLRATVAGYLEARTQDGRYGSALWLKWTHWLLVDAEVDIRDAYNSQLDPNRNNASGDTVVLLDSAGISQTAFYVVFVEQIARGTFAAHQRVYLDRFQPSAWPTDGT